MNCPSEFFRQLEGLLGPEAEAFRRALAERPALAIRFNPGRPGIRELAARYAGDPVPWWTNGAYLVENTRPGGGILHFSGGYYLQEASAMAPAAVLNPRAGERVLDLCAAPGGKSGQLAAAMGGRGLLICNEPDAARARMLAGNLERLGILAAVTSEYPDRLAEKWPDKFDAVLCDAPCSGEGMFRREPVARAQWSAAAPRGCAKRQIGILRRAAEMVRPGGRIVYSTCTFNDLENEGAVGALLSERSDFSLEDFALPGVGPSRGGMLRIWPHRVRGDGQFMALLRRAGDRRAEAAPRRDEDVPGAEAFVRDVGPIPDFGGEAALARFGERGFSVHRELPDMAGIRVVSPGIALFAAKKNRAEPEHPLAMALNRGDSAARAALDFERARRFLMGEAVPSPGPGGWAIAEYMGMPLGWGKRTEGTLKNHLPKGLRRKVEQW